jgi:glucosamine--fructose-6-phosphate aminotransferase (isomerizing)
MTLMQDETRECAKAAGRCLAQGSVFASVARRVRTLDPSLVVVCARGSSGHAGTFLRYILARDLGVVAAAAMPSIASLYARRQRMAGALFVAVSQSGRSPDLLRTAEAARDAGALCLAIVNAPDSPLAAASELVIDIDAEPERSVAATKTVIATMAASLALTSAWSGDRAMARAARNLPERLERAVALDWSVLVTALAGQDRVLAVGRGPGLAVAAEAALKLSEVAGIAGLAYSSAELSHGPRVLAGPAMPVLGFVQDDAAKAGTVGVLRELADLGVPVLAAGADGAGVTALPVLPPEHADSDLIVQLASFYIAAEAIARARGHDPDHPPGLLKVTETM